MPGAVGDSSRMCGRERQTAKADKNCDNNDYGSDKAGNAQSKCWTRSLDLSCCFRLTERQAALQEM
jgi:hypothetical protein